MLANFLTRYSKTLRQGTALHTLGGPEQVSQLCFLTNSLTLTHGMWRSVVLPIPTTTVCPECRAKAAVEISSPIKLISA